METLQQDRNDLPDFDKLAEMKQELGSSFPFVLQHFQAGVLTRPEKIGQAVKENDAEQVAMESHSLKSVCKQIGLYRMGEMAAELEALGKSGKLDGAVSRVERLIAAGVSAHRALELYGAAFNKPQPFFAMRVPAQHAVLHE
ncbi:MAG: Hpt domain-containing protein [Magnetococcales bacterium]|nr:Hpt domain-containing protein [Magnetococcales bacterium]